MAGKKSDKKKPARRPARNFFYPGITQVFTRFGYPRIPAKFALITTTTEGTTALIDTDTNIEYPTKSHFMNAHGINQTAVLVYGDGPFQGMRAYRLGSIVADLNTAEAKSVCPLMISALVTKPCAGTLKWLTTTLTDATTQYPKELVGFVAHVLGPERLAKLEIDADKKREFAGAGIQFGVAANREEAGSPVPMTEVVIDHRTHKRPFGIQPMCGGARSPPVANAQQATPPLLAIPGLREILKRPAAAISKARPAGGGALLPLQPPLKRPVPAARPVPVPVPAAIQQADPPRPPPPAPPVIVTPPQPARQVAGGWSCPRCQKSHAAAVAQANFCGNCGTPNPFAAAAAGGGAPRSFAGMPMPQGCVPLFGGGGGGGFHHPAHHHGGGSFVPVYCDGSGGIVTQPPGLSLVGFGGFGGFGGGGMGVVGVGVGMQAGMQVGGLHVQGGMQLQGGMQGCMGWAPPPTQLPPQIPSGTMGGCHRVEGGGGRGRGGGGGVAKPVKMEPERTPSAALGTQALHALLAGTQTPERTGTQALKALLSAATALAQSMAAPVPVGVAVSVAVAAPAAVAKVEGVEDVAAKAVAEKLATKAVVKTEPPRS
jgi:hypothetical protein